MAATEVGVEADGTKGETKVGTKGVTGATEAEDVEAGVAAHGADGVSSWYNVKKQRRRPATGYLLFSMEILGHQPVKN